MDERDVAFWTDAIDRVFNAASGAAREGETIETVRAALLPVVQARLAGEAVDGRGEDLTWLSAALGQPGMSLGVAVFFWRLGWMPERLFEPMIAAAVDAGEPEQASADATRPFVAACRTTFGADRIAAELLARLEQATPRQQLGATRALRIANAVGRTSR